MNVTYRCPECEGTVRLRIENHPTHLACSNCGRQIAVPPGAVAGNRIMRCLVCPSTDLFARKDFPQRLGVALVVLGFVGSSIAWANYQVLWSFAILFGTALIDLVRHPGLTEAQWETLLTHPRMQELPRLVKRERLLKELRGPALTEEVFQRCTDEGDEVVHRAMLNLPDIPRGIVEALHERGANKAVRNIAGVMLRRLKRRDQTQRDHSR